MPVIGISTDSTQSVRKEIEDQAPISKFEAYSNSLHKNTAESSKVVTSQPSIDAFDDELDKVEQLEPTKLPSERDIILRYPAIVQPVSRIVSCLLSTQVSVERMFSRLKRLIRENKARNKVI